MADREDVGDWEGDLEGEGMPDMEILVERVRVPLEVMLGEMVTERVILGLRLWEGLVE